MRSAIYARCTGDDGSEKFQKQIDSCLLYASQKGIKIEQNDIYTDYNLPGSRIDRPGLNKLMDIAMSKCLNLAIVNDLSRFSRDNALLDTILNKLIALDVVVYTIDGNVNMPEIESKFDYQLQAIFAETFLGDLRKKTMRAQLRQKQLGYFLGERTFGYKSEPVYIMQIAQKGLPRASGYKMKILEYEAAVVERIFNMYAKGISPTKIVKILNNEQVPRGEIIQFAWNVATLRRLLRNEKYIGCWAWGNLEKSLVPDTGKVRRIVRPEPLFKATYEDLRIIPQDLWDKVQTKIQKVGLIRAN